jgi:hypothetical protein
MAWCSVKAEGHLYLHPYRPLHPEDGYSMNLSISGIPPQNYTASVLM